MLEGMGAEPPSGFVQRVRRGVSYRAGKALGRADRAVRRATSSARTRPTYLVIGAQKAGTTSLHHYLSQNPAVLTARVKEVQYFTKYYARGEGWYRGQFPLVTHERAVRRRIGVSPAVGEATAACLFDPRSPERVHAFDPEMKLVALLRDPIERAYSAFQMELRWGRETGTFEEALDREETDLPGVLERLRTNPNAGVSSGLGRSYVARGLYADQLERWLQLFDRDQLLILMSDDLDRGPCSDRVARRRVPWCAGVACDGVPAPGRAGVRGDGAGDTRASRADVRGARSPSRRAPRARASLERRGIVGASVLHPKRVMRRGLPDFALVPSAAP